MQAKKLNYDISVNEKVNVHQNECRFPCFLRSEKYDSYGTRQKNTYFTQLSLKEIASLSGNT